MKTNASGQITLNLTAANPGTYSILSRLVNLPNITIRSNNITVGSGTVLPYMTSNSAPSPMTTSGTNVYQTNAAWKAFAVVENQGY